MRRIGILEMAAPDKQRLAYWQIFLQGLREQGHIEGQDVMLDYRWADGHQERLASAAGNLVAAGVDVIVTAGTPAAAAAIKATSDIPIVMATGVSLGTQLSRPDAAPTTNFTGISDLPAGVSERRLLLLREAVGSGQPLGILADRANPSSPLAVRETKDAGEVSGISIRDYWLSAADQFDAILSAMRSDGIGGFVVAPGAMFFAKRNELATSALDHRLPAMSVRREYAEAGCLMAYGAPLRESYRQAAILVSRVLAGVRPADIPVAEPQTFDFVINVATARAMGLNIPPALSGRAEVIGA
jgi:putative tryptophan/tyrosine transport system substrate-binding protein